MQNKVVALKPQDVYLALKLVARGVAVHVNMFKTL